jgi:iron-sulfur cluster repair protein YtfE (RIC family)
LKNLIPTLKAQHQAVVKMVTTIDDAVGRKDLTSVAQTLAQLKTALLAHLELEDTQLYPELIRAAEEKKQQEIAEMAKTFANNMKHISKALNDFLGRYDGMQEVQLQKFNKDWPAIKDTLGSRVSAEETSLYKQYARLVGR